MGNMNYPIDVLTCEVLPTPPGGARLRPLRGGHPQRRGPGRLAPFFPPEPWSGWELEDENL